jgi:putative addiction module killer protein
MFEIEETGRYRQWFAKLKDGQAKTRVDMRLRRLRRGNFGDAKPVGQGVSELRIDYGPGYRVYFMRKDRVVIVLLAGGDKNSQSRDITSALDMAQAIRSGR